MVEFIDHCDWNSPGRLRFTGDPVAAVAHYNLPPAVTAELQAKMSKRKYDDIATIERDRIYSDKADYDDLRSMHFGGKGRICGSVSRSKWSIAATERALIYTAGEYTVAVPTVCGNVSLITRKERRHEQQFFWPAEDEGGDVPQGGGGTGFTFREGSDPYAFRSFGGYGGSTNSFTGGSGSGSGWSYRDTYFGGYGGGSGGSLIVNQGNTFNSVVNQIIVVLVTPFVLISVPPSVGPVSAIPEAPTWAMTLASLGAMVFMGRRRRHG